MTVRVIPRLDVKGPNLVKGIHLEGLRVLGPPEAFAEHYYDEGADEILYMDVVASLFGRNSLLDVIERTAARMFVPLAVGGGIRTLDDIREVLRAGGDKVVINTAVVQDPSFVRAAATAFGSSTVVVSVEAIRQSSGQWECFTDNGRQETGLDVVDWAERSASAGAGELMITSVDRDGTGDGFDLDLLAAVRARVDIPMIAGGGAGTASDVVSAVTVGGADAVSIGSLLHYNALEKIVPQLDRSAPDTSVLRVVGEGNTEFLRRGTVPRRFERTSLRKVKRHLANAGIPCRLEDAR